MIVDRLGHEHLRQRRAARLIPKNPQLVAFHRGVQWRTHFSPLGEELVQGARFKHVPGENVGAHVGAFFEQANRDVGVVFLAQLLQSYGTRKPYHTQYHHRESKIRTPSCHQ